MVTITSRVVANARAKGVVVYEYRQWGSLSIPTYMLRRRTRPHSLLPSKPADTLWQHITVTYDTGSTPVSFKKDMRTVERIGNERFKTGVSYNFCIDAVTGEVGVGQQLDAAGAHTLNLKKIPGYSYDQNKVSLAVSVIGMPGVKLTEKAGNALVNLIRALIEEGALTPDFDYNPHSMVAAKSCPTKNITDVMPGIKKAATDPEKVDLTKAAIAVARAARAVRVKEGQNERWVALREMYRKLRNM